MRSGTFRFTSYREGLASRGRGRPPRIFALPTIRDRLALGALKATLSDVYGISGPEPPQRKMGRVVDAVRSGSYSHFMKLDIQDYFSSIRHHVLLERLRRDIRSTTVLDLCDRAVRNSTVAFGERSRGLSSEPDGIPLGISISSVLAEVYLSDFDERFGADFQMFRYVDDVLVLLKDDRHPFSSMQSELRRLGLLTHPLGTVGKCEIGRIADGFQYLGYQLDDQSVVVASAGIRKIESELAHLISNAARVRKGSIQKREFDRLVWRLNLVIGGCVIDGSARGWIRYYNRVDNLTVLGHLDGLVRDLLRRYGLAGSINTKRFISAYWASLDNSKFRKYAFDLDNVTASDARKHLVELESWPRATVSALSDSEAQSAFRRQVRRHVIDIERDLEPAS
ncbi:reverse transcriptase domain-containing protein [Nocardioides aurantiacus]|nr:reverse transcriptase domain-containing protein [Nocardioides aurantiacus]